MEQPPFMKTKKKEQIILSCWWENDFFIYTLISFFFLPVIRFFSLVAVYLIGGVLFQIFVRKNSGKNAIPNASFWLDFPALVKVCWFIILNNRTLLTRRKSLPQRVSDNFFVCMSCIWVGLFGFVLLFVLVCYFVWQCLVYVYMYM